MDEITRQVKEMYEQYPFPASNIINVAYGNRIRKDLQNRGCNFSNIKILDAGCGSGEKVISLAKVFPDCEVMGWDITSASIQKAVDSDYVKDLFYSLDLKDRLKVMERLTNPGHHLFLVRRK